MACGQATGQGGVNLTRAGGARLKPEESRSQEAKITDGDVCQHGARSGHRARQHGRAAKGLKRAGSERPATRGVWRSGRPGGAGHGQAACPSMWIAWQPKAPGRCRQAAPGDFQARALRGGTLLSTRQTGGSSRETRLAGQRGLQAEHDCLTRSWAPDRCVKGLPGQAREHCRGRWRARTAACPIAMHEYSGGCRWLLTPISLAACPDVPLLSFSLPAGVVFRFR